MASSPLAGNIEVELGTANTDTGWWVCFCLSVQLFGSKRWNIDLLSITARRWYARIEQALSLLFELDATPLVHKQSMCMHGRDFVASLRLGCCSGYVMWSAWPLLSPCGCVVVIVVAAVVAAAAYRSIFGSGKTEHVANENYRTLPTSSSLMS